MKWKVWKSSGEICIVEAESFDQALAIVRKDDPCACMAQPL